MRRQHGEKQLIKVLMLVYLIIEQADLNILSCDKPPFGSHNHCAIMTQQLSDSETSSFKSRGRVT